MRDGPAGDAASTHVTSSRLASMPFWLSMAGGLLVIIEGVMIVIAGPMLVSGSTLGLGSLIFGMMMTILGAVIVWAAYSIRGVPAKRVTYGAVGAIFSVAALILAAGGFVIGSILGIIGGSWAIMSR